MPTIFGCTNTTLLIWRTTFQISLVPLYLNWNTCYVCAKQEIKIQIGWDNPNPLTEVFWHTIFIIYTVPVTCYAGLWMRPSDLGFNRVRKNCLLSPKKIACKKCDVSSQMVSSSDSNPSFDFVRFYFIPDPGKFRHSFIPIHSKLHLASIWDASQIANFLLLQFQIRTTSEGLITSGNCGTIFFNHQSLGHISCKWLIPRQPLSASIHSSNGLKISKYNLIRNQRPDDSIRNPLNWITSVLSINFVWYRKTHKKSQKKKKQTIRAFLLNTSTRMLFWSCILFTNINLEFFLICVFNHIQLQDKTIWLTKYIDQIKLAITIIKNNIFSGNFL